MPTGWTCNLCSVRSKIIWNNDGIIVHTKLFTQGKLCLNMHVLTRKFLIFFFGTADLTRLTQDIS